MNNTGMVMRAIVVGLLAIAILAIPGSDHVFGQGVTSSPVTTRMAAP